MPYAPRRQCPGRGPHTNRCPNLIKGRDRYCPTCSEYSKKEVRRYDKARDQTQERKFIHSPQWRKMSRRKLDQDPLCEMCLPKETMAVLVHHIDFNELNNDPSNHQSACSSCHEAIHKSGRFGRRKQ